MKRTCVLLVIATATTVFTALPGKEDIERPEPSYVGAKRCKICHLALFDSWKETRHAKAFSSLKTDEAKNPSCLVCHTTGHGTGGYSTEGDLIDYRGVQCEACHGAGSLYSRASIMRQPEMREALGLIGIDSTTCITCHNEKSPTFKGFAYREGLLTGTHTIRPGQGTIPP